MLGRWTWVSLAALNVVGIFAPPLDWRSVFIAFVAGMCLIRALYDPEIKRGRDRDVSRGRAE